MAKGTTYFYGRLWKQRGEAYQKKFPMYAQYYELHKEEIDKSLKPVEEEPVSKDKKKVK